MSTTPTKALYCHRKASSLASRWLSQRRRSRRHAQQRPSLEMLSRQCKELARRNLSTAVTYAAHGPPLAVLKRAPVAGSSAALSATEVRVKMLAAPINPSDINMVRKTARFIFDIYYACRLAQIIRNNIFIIQYLCPFVSGGGKLWREGSTPSGGWQRGRGRGGEGWQQGDVREGG